MRFSKNLTAVLITLSLTTSLLSAVPQEDIPGTRAYFDAYIDGRYSYTNNIMTLIQVTGALPSAFGAGPLHITGEVFQIVDKEKLLICQKIMATDPGSTVSRPHAITSKILLVNDTGNFTEGQKISVWAIRDNDPYFCTDSAGQTNTLSAYHTPIPNAITFAQYESLVKANVNTPDRILKLVSCKPMSSVIEYEYTVTNSQATITSFNSAYSGALTITNTLGGYPVTSIGGREDLRRPFPYTRPTPPGLHRLSPDITQFSIGAFANCRNLTSVIIPYGITNIGHRGFHGCGGLTNISIPASVTSIGDYAFSGCASLTRVTIPDNVTSIGYRAFASCSSLTSVTIPDSVTRIGDEAFSYCSSLTRVTIPDNVKYIGRGTFYNCGSLTSVTIPDSVTNISDNAFQGCTNLPPAVLTLIKAKTTNQVQGPPLVRRVMPVPGMPSSTPTSYAERLRDRTTQKTPEQIAAEKKQREQLEKLARETAVREIKRREEEGTLTTKEQAIKHELEENKTVP